MTRQYVFNYLEAGPGYIFRAPLPIARVACVVAGRWFGRTWDYAPAPEGL